MLPRSSRGYNSLMLELYDFAILKLSSLLFWRCQSAQFITLYRSHVSRRHLEVGVGTGYLLKRAVFPSHWVQLYILDSNPQVLRHASQYLSRYNPTVVLCDLMSNDWPALPQQQSIGMNYVWHALEGTDEARAQVFGRLADYLTNDGVLFGSSVVGIHKAMPKLSQTVSRHWLQAGLFNNQGDNTTCLQRALDAYFDDVHIWQQGQVMFFVAKQPRRPVTA